MTGQIRRWTTIWIVNGLKIGVIFANFGVTFASFLVLKSDAWRQKSDAKNFLRQNFGVDF